jgi:prefoldin alpha subunit
MPQEKDEKKIQELYMQFNMINQQISEFQKQIQMLEESINETNESIKGLNEISGLPQNKEILVPIVSGVFARAELKDNKEFIVNVGSGTATSKSSEEVRKLLEKQLEEMQKSQNSFVDNLHQMTLAAKEIRQNLKNLIENNK